VSTKPTQGTLQIRSKCPWDAERRVSLLDMSPARVASHLAIGTLVTIGCAAPASAGSERVRDASHDVLSGEYFSDLPPTRHEPGRRLGDIVRTKVTLGTDLVVTTTFRSLDAGVAEQEYDWSIATSEADFPWYAVLSVPQGSTDEHFFLADPVANQPHCGKADLDRGRRKVTLTIPADCLGNPRWVRIANGAMYAIEGQRAYYDDARRDGGVRHGWRFGPKVRAG
jgi:hypothetical protein